MKSWQGYYDRVGDTPNRFIAHVLRYVPRRKSALDLGAGNLRDAKYLRKSGFTQVLAVDQSPEMLAFASEGIECVVKPIECYLPSTEHFDLVISCNTLFFLPFEATLEVLRMARNGLRIGGVLACNLLGATDEWTENSRPGTDYVNESRLQEIQEGWQTLTCINRRWEDKKKHWHTWCLVLKKT